MARFAGYGPVGAALACLLGQYGARTLVIDKAPEILLAPRAIALDNEALRILQLAGLADDAFAKVVIPYVRMVCPHVGEFAKIDTSGEIDGHPKLVTFYQPDLERALRQKAATHESVTAATGVELLQFVDAGGVVRATLKTPDGAEHTVVARFLVGADGANRSQAQAALRTWLVREGSRQPLGSRPRHRPVSRPDTGARPSEELPGFDRSLPGAAIARARRLTPCRLSATPALARSGALLVAAAGAGGPRHAVSRDVDPGARRAAWPQARAPGAERTARVTPRATRRGRTCARGRSA